MTQVARRTGRNAPKWVSPPVNTHITDTRTATEIILRGQLVVFSASGASLCPTNVPAGDAHAVAVKDYVALQDNCEFLLLGEMEGYELAGGAPLVEGTPLYPSASAAGGIATDVFVGYTAGTTPVVNVPATVRMRACGPNMIRFNFV